MEDVKIKKEKLEKLDKVLIAWARKNNMPIDFKESGGKLIIHFDKDNNIRLVEVHKVLLKT